MSMSGSISSRLEAYSLINTGLAGFERTCVLCSVVGRISQPASQLAVRSVCGHLSGGVIGDCPSAILLLLTADTADTADTTTDTTTDTTDTTTILLLLLLFLLILLIIISDLHPRPLPSQPTILTSTRIPRRAVNSRAHESRAILDLEVTR